MSHAMWGFVIGLVLGIPFGFLWCAALVAGRQADDGHHS